MKKQSHREIWWPRKAEIRGVVWVSREILLKNGNHLFKLSNFVQGIQYLLKKDNACSICLVGILQNEWNNICQLTLKIIALEMGYTYYYIVNNYLSFL